MWDFIGANAKELGAGATAIAALAAGAWQWLLKNRAEKAKVGAEVAIAQSQGEVYNQLNERLKMLGDQLNDCNVRIDKLLEQNREKDEQIAKMKLHILQLEHTLRLHSINPPPMEA